MINTKVDDRQLMTHKCRGSIVVFSISRVSNPMRSRRYLQVTLDKERLQTLKDKCLGVFGLSNRKVKDKQSKRVIEE